MLLLGTAGTGKTRAIQTCLQEIQNALKAAKLPLSFVRVAAPTGSAAFNIRFQASTIHRLIQWLTPPYFHKLQENSDNLAALMITYPSTHGVFESSIKRITQIIHDNGGQVYMDGANMNAQVGLTNPFLIGAYVCHLNLHKTFSIPHGGGGPGVGPICVAKHLVDFLPQTNRSAEKECSVKAISGAPWGSAMACLISYGYICMMGGHGLQRATEIAILNANYIKKRIEKDYKVLYQGEKGRSAHELIIDCRPFKDEFGIDVMDIAKRSVSYTHLTLPTNREV